MAEYTKDGKTTGRFMSHLDDRFELIQRHCNPDDVIEKYFQESNATLRMGHTLMDSGASSTQEEVPLRPHSQPAANSSQDEMRKEKWKYLPRENKRRDPPAVSNDAATHMFFATWERTRRLLDGPVADECMQDFVEYAKPNLFKMFSPLRCHAASNAERDLYVEELSKTADEMKDYSHRNFAWELVESFETLNELWPVVESAWKKNNEWNQESIAYDLLEEDEEETKKIVEGRSWKDLIEQGVITEQLEAVKRTTPADEMEKSSSCQLLKMILELSLKEHDEDHDRHQEEEHGDPDMPQMPFIDMLPLEVPVSPPVKKKKMMTSGDEAEQNEAVDKRMQEFERAAERNDSLARILMERLPEIKEATVQMEHLKKDLEKLF